MKTIYIDNDFVCHIKNDGTMQEIQTDVFDGQPDEFIKGYRYVPQGETWVRSDGVEFHGVMVSPAKDYNRIMVDVAVSYLDDEQAESVSSLYPFWGTDIDYSVGDRAQYDGLLYRCVQAHTSQSDWIPPSVPALWVRTSTEEWPEWIQPQGAHDAYNAGDKVSHNGKHWISSVDANIWEPGVYGWNEAE